MSEWAPAWPRLDYAADRATIETLHLLLQLVGKLPLRLLPWVNHGWHVALGVSPRGFATRSLPAGERHYSVELDVLDAELRVECDNGSQSALPVQGRTIAEVQRELSALLASLGLPAPLSGAPNEIPDAVPFAEDRRPREWDADAARRLHGAFLCADRGFSRFRALYRGKSSPSHLFWGSFDLAVTRFSGRGAPLHPGGIPGLPDAVTREAYSHEVISAGFWPGGAGFEEAAFYAYAIRRRWRCRSSRSSRPGPSGIANCASSSSLTRRCVKPPIPTRRCSSSCSRRSWPQQRSSTGPRV